MAFCPRCGFPAKETEKFCRSCGAPLSAPSPAARSDPPGKDPVGRGLRAAILVVAFLCVATGALWALWPHIRPSAPQENPGKPVAIASSPAPRATAVPTPRFTVPPTSAPAPTAAPVTTLSVGSHWRGTIEIDHYVGDDDLNANTLPVCAFIGRDNGTPFFEIYDGEKDDSDTSTLLSMYVDLYDDHFVPVIGVDDAWFFEVTLGEQDVGPLTVYLRDGCLSFDYVYRSSTESCDLHILLYPDP